MMKALFTFFHVMLLLTLLLTIAMVQPVQGGYFMEMIVNNGKLPAGTQPCNSTDNFFLDGCFANSGARKLLRGTATNVTAHEHHDQRKALPLFCRDLCAGTVAKTCRAARCNGFRRGLQKESTEQHEVDERRDQSADFLFCDTTTRITNQCLDMMIARKLSASCKAFYDPKNRKATCRYIALC